MGKVEFEMDSAGVIALMKSSEMLDGCTQIANGIVSRLGDGYEADPYPGGKTRINVGIKTNTKKAYYQTLKNNTILKALQG
jgi:hypothetical protein